MLNCFEDRLGLSEDLLHATQPRSKLLSRKLELRGFVWTCRGLGDCAVEAVEASLA